MSNFYALIMAGGSGTRLWPLSRTHRPKQALQLVDQRTMFQHAVDRLEGLLPLDRVLVVTSQEYVPILSAQVPEIPRENFIVEPMAQGTAGAIGLATMHLLHRDPTAIMVVLTADHFIQDITQFRTALTAAANVAGQGHVVTLGIQPTYPSTGFGYIHRGELRQTNEGFDVFEVEAVVEKPDLPKAKEFLASGLYSWNSGMFIWQVSRIRHEFERQMPALYAQLQTIANAIGSPDYESIVGEVWPTVHRETIDYGIMEHCPDVMVIPVDIGWTDIGDWEAVYRMGQHDANENVVVGAELVVVDSSGILVHNDRPQPKAGKKKVVAAIGVQDIVVIDTEDALLICGRERAQDVRTVVDKLNANDQSSYL
jgi:mannose-1-phosphate guanylyltransferase